MTSKLIRLVSMPAMLAAMLIAGCADNTGLEPERVEVGQPRLSSGSGSGGEYLVTEDLAGGGSRTWRVVTSTLASGDPMDASALVDGSRDVYLKAGGHTLFIPENAVREPTYFTIEVLRTEVALGQFALGVDLKAYAKRNGVWKDIGAQGFRKRLNLYLSAEYVTPGHDLRDAEILWLVDGNRVKGLEESDGVRRETTRYGDLYYIRLEHFSSYILGTAW